MLTYLAISMLAAALGFDPLENAITIHIAWGLGLVWTGTTTTRPGTPR